MCLPKRRAVCSSGAAMGCQALRSEGFEPCHAHIPVQVFLVMCEEQACEESDVCELISAYARLCRQSGVCVDWRNPHLCRKLSSFPFKHVSVCITRLNLKPCLQQCSVPAPWSMTRAGPAAWTTVLAYRRCQATGRLPGETNHPVWTYLRRAVSVPAAPFCTMDSVCHQNHVNSVLTSRDTRIRWDNVSAWHTVKRRINYPLNYRDMLIE